MINTIYKITNQVNGKIYIGQTWHSMQSRWRKHCKPYSKCIFIRNAIQKYGEKNFTIEAVCYAIDQRDADFWEQHFITRYDSVNRDKGYNLCAGGFAGHVYSKEARKKMSLAKIGVRLSIETRKKLSDAKKGKPSNSAGKPWSEKRRKSYKDKHG